MRGHGLGAHMWMCAAMLVVALLVVLATGSGLFILPALGCMLMMAAMMWLIMGGTGATAVTPTTRTAARS